MDHLIDDSDRLKPCPFCGSEAEMLTMPQDTEATAGAMFVQCTNSMCMASSALVWPLMDDVKPLLLERWNKRPASNMRKALRELLEIEEARIETGAFTPNAEAQRTLVFAELVQEQVAHAGARYALRDLVQALDAGDSLTVAGAMAAAEALLGPNDEAHRPAGSGAAPC